MTCNAVRIAPLSCEVAMTMNCLPRQLHCKNKNISARNEKQARNPEVENISNVETERCGGIVRNPLPPKTPSMPEHPPTQKEKAHVYPHQNHFRLSFSLSNPSIVSPYNRTR